LGDLNIPAPDLENEMAILVALKSCAEETVPSLIRHKLHSQINSDLVRSIDLKGNPERTDITNVFREALIRTKKNFNAAIDTFSIEERIDALESNFQAKLQDALASDQWLKTFRGRDILRRFCGKYVKIVSYEPFRDLILARMRQAQFKPPGMKRVVDEILSATQT
jgi:hypothetical protein